jgi:hypothetical protein
MFLPRLKDGLELTSKTYSTGLISGNHDSTISSDLTAMSDAAESIDGFN